MKKLLLFVLLFVVPQTLFSMQDKSGFDVQEKKVREFFKLPKSFKPQKKVVSLLYALISTPKKATTFFYEIIKQDALTFRDRVTSPCMCIMLWEELHVARWSTCRRMANLKKMKKNSMEKLNEIKLWLTDMEKLLLKAIETKKKTLGKVPLFGASFQKAYNETVTNRKQRCQITICIESCNHNDQYHCPHCNFYSQFRDTFVKHLRERKHGAFFSKKKK